MSDFIKKHHIALILGIAGLVFIILFNYLNFSGPQIYNSPDETANFFFIKIFAEQNRIWHFESMNYYLDNLVHPRSTQVVNDLVVPGGFIGLIVIYGFIGKIIGAGQTLYLTPIFAVLAGLAWYAIVKKYFGKWVGLLSVLLVWTHPAWWYYSSRALFPNVLFVSLLIISAYFILARPFLERREKLKLAKNWFFSNLDLWIGALVLGLSLFVRPSEVFWIAAAGAIIILFNIRRIDWPALALFVVILVLALSPMLALNQAVYGSAFRSGYSGQEIQEVAAEDISTKVTTSETVSTGPWIGTVKNLYSYILPFGFHPRSMWNNFLNYHLMFNWWFSIFWLAGLIFLAAQIVRKKDFSKFQYILIFGLVSIWLAALYGSWNFHDNIDPTKVTIGNSYLRYWLPSFVLCTPLAAWAAFCLAKFLKNRALQSVWVVFFLALFLVLGGWATFYGEDEGLVYVRSHLERYKTISERVFEITSEDAIIITDRSDKIFFPQRRIIYPLRAAATEKIIPEAYLVAPLYYYGVTLPNEDLRYLNQDVYGPQNLNLKRLESFDNESLYIFETIKNENPS